MNSTTHNGKEYTAQEDSNGVITLTPTAIRRHYNLYQNKTDGSLRQGGDCGSEARARAIACPCSDEVYIGVISDEGGSAPRSIR